MKTPQEIQNLIDVCKKILSEDALATNCCGCGCCCTTDHEDERELEKELQAALDAIKD